MTAYISSGSKEKTGSPDFRFIGTNITLVVILFTALFIRLSPTPQEVFRDGFGIFGDTHLYHRIAYNLYMGNGFSGTLNKGAYGMVQKDACIEYEPAITRGPVYPFFLFAVYKILGNPEDMKSIKTWHRNLDKVRIVQAVLDASLCILLFLMVRIICPESIWPALISAILYCFCPYNIFYTKALLAESIATYLLTWTIFFCVMALKNNKSVWWWVGPGIGFGLVVLCRPEYLLVFPLLAVFILFLHRRNLSAGLKKAGVFLISAAIIISPWTIRNYALFKKLIIVAESGIGLNLFIGTYENEDSWKGWKGSLVNIPDKDEREEFKKLSSSAGPFFKVGSIRAKEFDDGIKALAIDRILNNPIDCLVNYIRKAPRLWYQNYIPMYGVKEASGLYFIFYFAFAICAYFGTERRSQIYFMPTVLIFFYLNVIFFPLHIEPRYSVALMPGIITLAGIGIWKGLSLMIKRIRGIEDRI